MVLSHIKKRIKLLPALLLGLIIFSSCSIRQHFIFEKNGSGKFELTLDMREVLQSMENFGGDTDEELEDISMDEFEDLAADREGISNFQYREIEKGLYSISYDFENYSQIFMTDELDQLNHFKMDLNKKNFSYSFKPEKSEFEDLETLNMIDINTEYTFEFKDRSIRKVSTQAAIKEQSKNSITLSRSLTELIEGDGLEVQLKLK